MGGAVDRTFRYYQETLGPVGELLDNPVPVVLVVDDHPRTLGTTVAHLKGLGYSVVTASSGELAIFLTESGFYPDVVLLAFELPGLGGASTLRFLRALRPTMPVILTTGATADLPLSLAKSYPQVTLLPRAMGRLALKSHLEQIGVGALTPAW
jgi:CheY-like chemotaxis protein